MGGKANSPIELPVCNSSTLATATMLPGPASSTGEVSEAWTSSSAAIFTGFRTPETVSVLSFFSVPEKTRMKFSFCTNGSMRVLKHCATSGPAGSDLSSTSSPAALTPSLDERRRKGEEGQGIEQFGKADAGLARDAKNGNQRARHGHGDEFGSSSSPGGCPRSNVRSRPHPLR